MRFGILVFALLLGIHAAWTLTPELVRPPQPDFPVAGARAAVARNDLNRAVFAATLAVVRGDLWADGAILLAGGLQDDIDAGKTGQAPTALADARAMAERAVRLSPHDSRIWLLIAAIDARLDWLDRRVGAPLKMSYYTAPNDAALRGRCSGNAPRLRVPVCGGSGSFFSSAASVFASDASMSSRASWS